MSINLEVLDVLSLDYSRMLIKSIVVQGKPGSSFLKYFLLKDDRYPTLEEDIICVFIRMVAYGALRVDV